MYGVVEPERLLRSAGGRPREDARNAALAAIVDVAGIRPVRLLVGLGVLPEGEVSSDSPAWGWLRRALAQGRDVLGRQRAMTRKADHVVALVELHRELSRDPRALVSELSSLLQGLPGVGRSAEQIRAGLLAELGSLPETT